MKKDLAIGLVGTLILLTAMLGVFQLEAATPGSAWRMTWSTSEAAGPGAEGRTLETETTTVALNFTRAMALNATQVVFALRWTDDVPASAADRFSLLVTSPSGANFTASAESDGTIELPVSNVALTPTGRVENAASEADAHASAARLASAAAVGVWTVQVVCEDAGDQGVVGDLTIAQDDGNDWVIETQLVRYNATVTRA